jgi:hypothetical protein
MPLTFAYGSNMCVADMAARCPGARLLGAARLPKFRFALLPDGFATLERDPAAMTHGVLWELSFGALAALDRYEGEAYEKLVLPVLRAQGGVLRALVYLAAPNAKAGRAPADYMEKIVASAIQHALPREHVEFLRACAGLPASPHPEGPAPRFRAIKNESRL